MVEIVFWDVQHGSAAYIKTPNNRHVIVDLGTGSYGSNKPFSPLLHLKNSYKVTSADMVFITHPHRDHIDDIFNFDAVNPKILWRPKHLSEQDIRKANRSEDQQAVSKYCEISARFSGSVSGADSLNLPDNWGGAQFQIFSTTNCAVSNLNNQSGVLLMTYGVFKVLFTGDNESASWTDLLADKTFCSAIKGTHVFLASHHGRESGYCGDLFQHFKPAMTVVSDGRFCDTSATSRYSNVSAGWIANYPDGTSETRYCVTTRNDGVVRMTMRKDGSNNLYTVNLTKGSAKTQAARRMI